MLHMSHCIRLSRYMLYYILVSNKYEQSGVRSHAKNLHSLGLITVLHEHYCIFIRGN